jgi:phosphate transport system substrate-binding protein
MRLGANLILLAIATSFLGACAPAATPAPTPVVQQVIITPAYADLVKTWFDGYLQVNPDVFISLVNQPPEAALASLEDGSGDVLIGGLTPPAGWFATPLSEDGIVVVVHPDLGVRDLSIDELAAIFTGRMSSWDSLADTDLPIQPVISLPGDEVRAAFQSTVMNGQRFTNNALLGPTPAAVLQLVDENEGAIGFLPYSAIGEKVRPIRVEGTLPGKATIRDGRYPLPITILAIAPQEPSGDVRSWLVWIQSELQPAP